MMEAKQQALLERILSSRFFSQAVTLGRILRFVCEKTANSDRCLKEYEIAVEALGRPVTFDPKCDPVVRVSMKAIRERVQAYFNADGLQHGLYLSIPKGHYCARFTRFSPQTLSVAQSKETAALQEFWYPYLCTELRNLLLYPQLLFLRTRDGTYIRNRNINDPVSAMQGAADFLPYAEVHSLEPCFHFISEGEFHCVVSFMRMFQDLCATLDIVNSRTSSWHTAQNANLILIGCPRTNQFMDSLQEGRGFVITEKEIRDLAPGEGDKLHYSGRRYRDGKLHRFSEYALITRRPGLCPGSAVTMIAANHGRAVQGAANYLTTGNGVAGLLIKMRSGSAADLPSRFQVLVQVDMIDIDDEVVSVTYVTHRTPPL